MTSAELTAKFKAETPAPNPRVAELFAPIAAAIKACEDYHRASTEDGNEDTNFLGDLCDALGDAELAASARMTALAEMEQQILAELNGARWAARERDRTFAGERRGA